ncbi:hypothetical protein QFZ20_001077 [Flavobacterium sp. W4I14]|nr:hypothetical protein [Flavobacterium sp. W4I14]
MVVELSKYNKISPLEQVFYEIIYLILMKAVFYPIYKVFFLHLICVLLVVVHNYSGLKLIYSLIVTSLNCCFKLMWIFIRITSVKSFYFKME